MGLHTPISCLPWSHRKWSTGAFSRIIVQSTGCWVPCTFTVQCKFVHVPTVHVAIARSNSRSPEAQCTTHTHVPKISAKEMWEHVSQPMFHTSGFCGGAPGKSTRQHSWNSTTTSQGTCETAIRESGNSLLSQPGSSLGCPVACNVATQVIWPRASARPSAVSPYSLTAFLSAPAEQSTATTDA